MKKAKKLLAVLLAVVMALSCMSVMAVAYDAADNEYNDYGKVTRVSTTQRAKLLLNGLDQILASANFTFTQAQLNALAGVNVGSVGRVIGLTVYDNIIDARSIDDLMWSLDSLFMSNGNYSALGGKNGLLDVALHYMNDVPLRRLNGESAGQDWWNNGYTNIRRSGGDINLIVKLVEYIAKNKDVFTGILEAGKVEGVVSIINVVNINLGDIVAGISIPNVGGINDVLGDLPGLVKNIVYGLFNRWDDTAAVADLLKKTATNKQTDVYAIDDAINDFVRKLLTSDMTIIDYTDKGNGADAHPSTLTYEDGYRYKFSWDGANLVSTPYDDTDGSKVVTYMPVAQKDADGNPTGRYYYETESGSRLQWYEDGSKAIHALDPAFAASINVNTDKPLDLLYTFIPVLFDEFGDVPLNGSLKKEMAWLFGAQWGDPVGSFGDADLPDDPFFTTPKEFYLIGDYSDYKVIDGEHWWRYGDNFYKADLSNTNRYFDMINWNFNFDVAFVNQFVDAAKAGTPLLKQLNAILCAIAQELLSDEFWAESGLALNTTGGNDVLVENVKNAARAIVNWSPAAIFGANFDPESGYYKLMMDETSTNDDVLNGLAATIIKLVMPQFILPSAENLKGQKIGAILTAVVRELATQMLPDRDYDSFIYDDYNNKVFLSGKDNAYWLDVALTIGVDIGVHYLQNLVDLGEGTDKWTNGMQWDTVGLTLSNGVKAWEGRIDYLLDWALCSETYGYKLEKLLGVSGDLATPESPYAKVGKVLAILPLGKVLNVDTTAEDWVKTTLIDNGLLAIFNLNIAKFIGSDSDDGLLTIPAESVLKTKGVIPAIIDVVRELFNNIGKTVTNDANFTLIPEVTTLESVIAQSTLTAFVGNLIGALPKAINGSDGGILAPAFTVLNSLIGEKLTEQTYSDPAISCKGDASGINAFILNNGAISGTVSIRNTANGVNYRHLNAAGETVTDNDYVVRVNSVKSFNPNISIAASQTNIVPGASVTFTLSGSNLTGGTAFAVEVKYEILGKNGAPLGGEMSKVFYSYIASETGEGTVEYGNAYDTYEEASMSSTLSNQNKNFSKGDWLVGVQRHATQKVIYVDTPEQAINIVNNLEFGFTNNSHYSNGNGDNRIFVSGATLTGNSSYVTMRDDFVWTNGASAYPSDDFAGIILAGQNGATSNDKSIVLYHIDDTEENRQAIAENGKIDLGTIDMQWSTRVGTNMTGSVIKTFTWNRDKGLYNLVDDTPIQGGTIIIRSFVSATDELKNLFNQYQNELQRANYADDAEAEWTAMIDAMRSASVLVNAIASPALVDAAKADGRFSEANQKAIVENLKAAYEALEAKRAASFKDVLQDAMDQVTAYYDKEESDFRLSEFWAFNDIRTHVQGRLAAYEAYEADTTGTVWQPDYTATSNADLAEKLVLYYEYMHAQPVAGNDNFLKREIAAADAQNYDEAAYTAESWAAYQEAYNAAKALDASAQPSALFGAKYNLMLTQNQLAPFVANDPVLVPEDPDGQESGGIIATEDGYVYGMPAGAVVEEYFQVKDGTMEVLPSTLPGQALNGTGAQVLVKNNAGDVVATYTLVVFGDLNGDGNVDSTDSSFAMQSVSRVAGLSDIQVFAGDLNADDKCDSTDVSFIMQKVARLSDVTTNPYA